MNPIAIDPIFLSVTILTMAERDTNVGTATGFFFKHNDKLWLITNHHVVVDPNEDKTQWHRYDTLKLLLHNNPADLTENATVHVPLFAANGRPTWRQPTSTPDADVVAIPLTGIVDPTHYFLHPLTTDNLLPEDLVIAAGHEVIVIGYPRAFRDEVNNLPVARDAAVASPYGIQFDGLPNFVIDAQLHRGTSGSPVVTKLQTSFQDRFGSTRMDQFPHYLLGVNSDIWLLSVPGEPSGLNSVWYPSLIMEMIQ